MTNEILYAIFLIVTASVAGFVAVFSWLRGRMLPSGPPLTLLAAALCWWSGSYALYWLDTPAPYPTFWSDSTFIGIVIVPTAGLLFALLFVDPQRRISPLMLAALAVEPLFTLIVMYSDPGDGLFFAGTRPQSASSGLMGGPVFWLNVVYNYVVLGGFFVLLTREFLRSRGLYRKQTAIFLLGGMVPWIVNALALLGYNPMPDLDLTPISLTLTGACMAYGLLFYGLLDVLPVARSALVELMSEGVMVLDAKGRIVYVNDAFCEMTGVRQEKLIGQHPSPVLSGWPDLVVSDPGAREYQDEIVLSDENQRCLEVRGVPLFRDGNLSGRLVVVRDVSERKRSEDALRAANNRLQDQLGEITRLQEQLREQATRDALTGLFNRRYLEETLERELAAAHRSGQPLSLVGIDVDFFKRINDSGGHPAGDRVLQELARLLQAHTRGSDVVSRFGGEEFVILLPGADVEQARRRAEEWRGLFECLVVDCDGLELQTTFSAGVAGYPDHGGSAATLMFAADEALYAAKRGGRNRVEVYAAGDARSQSGRLRPAITAASAEAA